MGQKLDGIRQEVHKGKGFGVIRGLDPEKYSVEDLTMLYLGLQSFVANRQGRQDSKGNMMGTSCRIESPVIGPIPCTDDTHQSTSWQIRHQHSQLDTIDIPPPPL